MKLTQKEINGLMNVKTTFGRLNQEGYDKKVKVFTNGGTPVILIKRDGSLDIAGKNYIGNKFMIVSDSYSIYTETDAGDYAMLLQTSLDAHLVEVQEKGYLTIETPKTKVKLIPGRTNHFTYDDATSEFRRKRERAIRLYSNSVSKGHQIIIAEGA